MTLSKEDEKEIARRTEFAEKLTTELLNSSWSVHKTFKKKNLFVEPHLIFGSMHSIATDPNLAEIDGDHDV